MQLNSDKNLYWKQKAIKKKKKDTDLGEMPNGKWCFKGSLLQCKE